MTESCAEYPLARRAPLLDTHVPVMKSAYLNQIRRQPVNDDNYADILGRAELNSIGYVTGTEPCGDMVIWLIVREGIYLWRWNLADADLYEAACEEHPWLAEVPQVFLDE